MRWRDLFGLALLALWQQRTRSLLTLTGVLLGACMLTVSLALGYGLRSLAFAELRKDERLRVVAVYPNYEPPPLDESAVPPAEREVHGAMSEEKRQRLRQFRVNLWRNGQPRRLSRITFDKLAQLAALDHVVRAVPELEETADVALAGKPRPMTVVAVPEGLPAWESRLTVGRWPRPGAREALVSEWTLYSEGITDDADVARVVGRRVRLTILNHERSPYLLLGLLGVQTGKISPGEALLLNGIADRIPALIEKLDLRPAERQLLAQLLKNREPGAEPDKGPARVEGEFTIVGVLRLATEKEQRSSWWEFRPRSADADLAVPPPDLEALVAPLPRRAEGGVYSVNLTVDSEQNIGAVVDAVRALGFREYSLQEFASRVFTEVTLISVGMVVLSVLALVVAGLGITNTMVTSVLERTREIGVMKAVGARDRQILVMFLIEGTFLGVLGGALGLLAGWLLSLPAEGWMHQVVEQQAQSKIDHTIFLFPAWLVAGAPVFAGLVTTLAAVIPARRAARVDPVVALRTE